jgi:hypothetical protein
MLEVGLTEVSWLVAVAPLSKYKTSPVEPGSKGKFENIRPNGLTPKSPSSGVSTAVTTPKTFSTSDAIELSA